MALDKTIITKRLTYKNTSINKVSSNQIFPKSLQALHLCSSMTA